MEMRKGKKLGIVFSLFFFSFFENYFHLSALNMNNALNMEKSSLLITSCKRMVIGFIIITVNITLGSTNV